MFEGDLMYNEYWRNCHYYNFYRLPQSDSVGLMMYYDGHSDYILDCQDGDVNGDRVRDSVCTVGFRPGDLQSPFVENITILIQDGVTHKYTRIPLKENRGYDPTVFLGDFTGDKIDDIFVSVASSGSGGFSYDYVYSFVNNNPKLLFDSEEFSQSMKNEAHFIDNYKLEVISRDFNQRYIIDISDKGQEYLSELYNPDGTLKAEINTPFQGAVIPLGNVYPVDYERDRVYELEVIQRVIGKYNADTLGWLQTVIKWDGKKFVPSRQVLAIFGSEI
jgi:hypothetical protein